MADDRTFDTSTWEQKGKRDEGFKFPSNFVSLADISKECHHEVEGSDREVGALDSPAEADC